jgi:hypothetical protein
MKAEVRLKPPDLGASATLISVLSLVVAGLAVFVARTNVQRQLQVTARETWMRELREQSTIFLARLQALRGLVGGFPSSNAEEDLRPTVSLGH